MSRSNRKVAIVLREADTIKTNKAVLKAGGLPYGTEVFDVLDTASSKYEDKMANLIKFNSRSKKTLKISSHKMEWFDEQTRLQNLANKIELSVGSILDTVIAQSPDDEPLHELMDITNGYYNARKKNQSEISGQLHNIKEMLKESRKRQEQPAARDKQGKENENERNLQLSTTNAIIAELFVKLRTDQAKVWQYWLKQEQQLRKEVQVCSYQLATSIRNDQLATQDMKLREEFASILSSCSACSSGGVGSEGSGASITGGARGSSSSLLSPRRRNDPGFSSNHSTISNSISNSNSSICIGIAPPEDGTSLAPGSLAGTGGGGGGGAASRISQRLEADLELAMDEWLHKVAVLDKAQELRAIERETERALALQELGLTALLGSSSSAGGVSGGGRGKNGGWSENDHDMFVKIYRKAHVTGMPRKQLLDILVAELPGQSQDAIVLHEEWYRKMKYIANKYKEGEQAYTVARAELVEQAKTALREYRDQRLEMLEREREAEMHEKRRAEIHERLQELSAQKEVLNAEQRAEREKQEAELRAKLAAQEEAMRLERLEKKQQVERYRELKEAAEAEAQRQHEAQVRAAQEAVKQLIEENRPRVERREQLLGEKEDRRRQKEIENELEEMRRIELLNKLAAQVPYYDAIQDATSKLDHVTASAKGHEYIAPEEPGVRGHLPLNGFTDGRVIQDSRFRLAEALRRHGVAGSQAAHAAVAQFFPRPHLAIHGLL